MPVQRDRTIHTLELLADADKISAGGAATKHTASTPSGLLTTEIVDLAGEAVNQRTLTWFGGVLRYCVQQGWVARAGKTTAGWQSPAIQRWQITPAGRQHVLHVQARRAARRTAEKAATAAIRRRQAAMKKARREYNPASATREDREQVTLLLRDAGVKWTDIAGVTGLSYQTAMNDYQRAARHWPAAISPRPAVHPFSPKSPRFSQIAEVLAGETGLEAWQTQGVLRVMHALGIRISVPPGFRYRTAEEEAHAEAVATGKEGETDEQVEVVPVDGGVDAAVAEMAETAADEAAAETVTA
jgi:hypothetical protein